MEIGLIIYGRLDTLTGGYIYDRMLVEHLRRHGHHVEVISLPHKHYTRHLLDNLSPGLFSRLVSANYDLLLQDELNHPSLFRLNHRLRKSSAVPIVAIVHQVLCRQPRNGFINRLYEAVERPYLNSVNAFIFNSNTSRKTVEQLVDHRKPSIVASPAGDRLGYLTSPDRIASRARQPGPIRLIFVGNVLPIKGLLPLVRGLAKLPSKIWQLTVVGSLKMDHRYHRSVEKLIAAKNMKQQVKLVGPKDGSELAALLADSHVFVMPYSHEGFGMAHLEAMGYALPVIGSSAGAVSEYVIPGQNGYLTEPADYESVNECLDSLYRDRQKLIKMSCAALQTFRSRPNWYDTLGAIHGFLNKQIRQK